MKKELNNSAKKIAKHGRYGDDRLLHVSQSEIDGLASLVPGGRLPINPDTGLPEAFFFLPFLAALGAAAPAAAATAAIPTAAALGATAALPAAATAALPAAASGLAAGAGSAASGGLAALAAPTAATAAMPAIGATGATALPTLAGTAGLPSVLAGTPMAGSAALPAAGGLLAPTAAAANPIAAATGGGAIGSSVVPGAGTAATLADAGAAAGVTGLSPAASTAAGAGKGLAGLMGGLDTGKMLQYGALASMMLPKGGGGGSGKDKVKSKGEIGAKDYSRGDQSANTDDGSSGASGSEWKYFPAAHYYAEGGLASLDNSSGGSTDDEQLIDATIAAIQGQMPNAQQIIQTFVQQFGPEALQHLVQQVQGQQSQSDGLSDSIPAQVQGQGGMAEPAQLSEGEYVVPSDVVSHLGNGSTSAGERQLSDMVSRTRQARGAKAPNAIDPSQVMPA